MTAGGARGATLIYVIHANKSQGSRRVHVPVSWPRQTEVEKAGPEAAGHSSSGLELELELDVELAGRVGGGGGGGSGGGASWSWRSS